MKCDELKYERLYDAFETYPDSTLVIRKQYVDAAIAELKAKLESVQATAYTESVDAGMRENRKLKRALWIARAERAKWASLYYWYAISDKYKSRKFDEVERKCRAKVEEYK